MNGSAPSPAQRPHVEARFPVRKPSFDFSDVPERIYRDNAFESSFWLVLQALFPDGEQFFIDAVRDVSKQVEIDPQLARDIRAFMGQEAVHGRAHRDANAAIFARHGVDVKKTENRTRAVLSLINRLHTPMQRLAMTAGAEHFTSTLASFMMKNRDYHAGFNDPEVQRLILWHCLEEREHRSVAFDLFQRAGGSYFLRATMLPWFVAMLLPLIGYEIGRLMVESGAWRDREATRKGFRAVRRVLKKLRPGMRDYFRRDFHPSDDDLTALEAALREELALAS